MASEMSQKGGLGVNGHSAGEASSLSPSSPPCVGDAAIDGREGVLVNVFVPELKIQKRVLIDPDETLWVAKILFLSSLDKELRDGLNYSFYLPPAAGRPGCFLSEERTLREWPEVLAAPVGLLEFAHKRRLVRSVMSLNVRKLRQLHSQSQLRQFMEMVKTSRMDKLQKCLNKGFDPNYQDADTGETPMTQACMQEDASRLLLALVGGGAHLDFRSRHSFTPLHVAAIHGNIDAVKTLIELGASVESKDKKGLPPLYHVTALRTGSPQCAQLLLTEHAMIGYRDENGYTELHQACKNGNSRIVDLLAFYGADLNAQSCGGGTALHLCVANNEISCLKTLLMRGANPVLENLLHQVPLHVAIVMGHKEAADILNQHNESSLRPFTELPTYNLQRPRDAAFQASVMARQLGPGSRRLSVSALQLHTSGSVGSRSTISTSQRDLLSHSCYVPSSAESAGGGLDDDDNSSSSDHWSLSARSDLGHLSLYLPGHRRTAVSEVDDVMSVSDSFWAGRAAETESLSSDKSSHGIMLRHKSSTAPRGGAPSLRRLTFNESLYSGTTLKDFEFMCSPVEQARTVVLTKGRKGFGFVLRGAKADQLKKMGMVNFVPSERMPALQYLDSIDKGSIADKAGLKAGDFILELNGMDVSCLCHEDVVQLIKRSGDILALKVITLSAQRQTGPSSSTAVVAAPAAAAAATAQTSRSGADGEALLSSHGEQQVQLSAAGHSSAQIVGVDQQLAKEEESQVLEQLDETLANYDSQSTGSSSTHAGSSVSSDAVAAAASSTCARPLLPAVLLRSQSSGSCASTAGPLHPSQKVASIRARPASRLITAAAELEGMFSSSWHSGSSGAGGSQPVSHAVVPPPPPVALPPPIHQQHYPAVGSRSSATVAAAAAAAAPSATTALAQAGDSGSSGDQVKAAKPATFGIGPETDSSQAPSSLNVTGKSKPEIVPLVLESLGSFSIGKGSDFNTFRGPLPPPLAEARQNVNHHSHHHRLTRGPVPVSPLASPDGESLGIFPRFGEANGSSTGNHVGIGEATGQMHSAPMVRRHMSHPAPPSQSAASGDLHRSSSAAAVDAWNSASCSISSTAKNGVAGDDMSGSQNSVNSSGSSSSFADAIRKAAAAVRNGSPASSPASEHAYPPLHSAAAVNQKPTPPLRSSVLSSRESGGDSRALAARASSGSTSSNGSASGSSSSIAGSRVANRARTSGSDTPPSPSDGHSVETNGSKGDAIGASQQLATVLPHQAAAARSTPVTVQPATAAAGVVVRAELMNVATAPAGHSAGASAAGQGALRVATAVAASTAAKVHPSLQLSGVSGAAGPASVQRAAAAAASNQERSGSSAEAAAAAGKLPAPSTAADAVAAHSVKGIRSAFEVNVASRAASAGASKQLAALPGGASGNPGAAQRSPLQQPSVASDRAGSAAAAVSTAAAAAAVPASDSSKKPAPPPPPAKRVLVKTEHYHPFDDSGAAMPLLLPPPPMFHSSPPQLPPPYSAPQSPAPALQHHSEDSRPEAATQLHASSSSSASAPGPGALQQQRSSADSSGAGAVAAKGEPSPLGSSSGSSSAQGSSRSAAAAPASTSHRHHHRHHHRQEAALPPPPQQQQRSPVANGGKSSGGGDGRSQGGSANGGGSSSSGGWRPFMGKHVEMWTVDDVSDWLESVGLSEYRRTFVDNCIEGEALVNLTRSEFKELGIDKVGHRVKFEREVLKLMAVSSV